MLRSPAAVASQENFLLWSLNIQNLFRKLAIGPLPWIFSYHISLNFISILPESSPPCVPVRQHLVLF
jgi:hypothetical protein